MSMSDVWLVEAFVGGLLMGYAEPRGKGKAWLVTVLSHPEGVASFRVCGHRLAVDLLALYGGERMISHHGVGMNRPAGARVNQLRECSHVLIIAKRGEPLIRRKRGAALPPIPAYVALRERGISVGR
jgi:hypothetical protein